MTPDITEQITFIYVEDLERTSEFYEMLFGFELVLDQGTCRIVKTTAGSFLGYCQRTGGGGFTPDLILTFVTPDVDGWYQKLLSNGVSPQTTPQVNEYFQIYHFFLFDPDGYKLEFQRFLDPGWSREKQFQQ